MRPLTPNRTVRVIAKGTGNPGDLLVLADGVTTAADKGKVRKVPDDDGTYRLVGIAEEAFVDGQLVRCARRSEHGRTRLEESIERQTGRSDRRYTKEIIYMPSLSEITASPMLKEFAQGAAQSAVQPVADFLAPTVEVPTSIGRYKIYTEKNRFRPAGHVARDWRTRHRAELRRDRCDL